VRLLRGMISILVVQVWLGMGGVGKVSKVDAEVGVIRNGRGSETRA
jgi:hypothetical protein